MISGSTFTNTAVRRCQGLYLYKRLRAALRPCGRHPPQRAASRAGGTNRAWSGPQSTQRPQMLHQVGVSWWSKPTDVATATDAAPGRSQLVAKTAGASPLTKSRSWTPELLSHYPSYRGAAVHCRLVAPARLVERRLRIEPRSLHDLTSFPWCSR